LFRIAARLIHRLTLLARIFQEEYRRLGGVETDFVEHSSSDATPLRTAAAKIRSSKPDLVFMTNYSQLVYLYKNAIERVGSTDPLKLRDAILATEMTGASGPIRFDSKGGVIKTPIFKRLSGKSRELFLGL
jgi:ABC-type branched-subunit amino acid transport system substrate-binding protein